MSPKILTLPRSDAALCFAGDTSASYPLALQIANAIAAHQPARERNLDVAELKAHLLRVMTDIMASVRDAAEGFSAKDAQVILAGYSWRAKGFRMWSIYYEDHSKQFRAAEPRNFHPRLHKALFIGDQAKRVRARVVRSLNAPATTRAVDLEPLAVLAETLREAGPADTIGGAPQLVRIGPHMNTRALCVRWGADKHPTLYGRRLFDYENCDLWIIDPDTGVVSAPRDFGRRDPEP